MKRLLYLFSLGLIAASLTSGAATAAPSPVSFSIGSQAQYVAPGTDILVPVTYNCPVSAGAATGFVEVFEDSTGGTGFGFYGPVPCTGQSRTVVVDVPGGPWTLGKAYARGDAFAGGFFQTDQRQIQIVL